MKVVKSIFLIFCMSFINYSSALSQTDCTISAKDMQKYMEMDYWSFDQTIGAGWRIYGEMGCFITAANVLDNYYLLNSEIPADQKRIIAFHSGQMYGFANNYHQAVQKFTLSLNPEEPMDTPILWNAYVNATIAFMQKDLNTLLKMRDQIAKSPLFQGKKQNLDVVDSFIKYFGKSYSEAYQKSQNSAPPLMEIAITVDDLPFSGELSSNLTRTDIARKMVKVFKKHHITGVYGLINGVNTSDPEGLKILQEWVKADQLLGNHTFTHLDLAKKNSKEYIDDIIKNESMLENLMGQKNYRYFRYPYLSEGNTQEKRDTIRQFLFEREYKIAPVTVDFFEYEWSDPYIRCLNKNDTKSIVWLKNTYLEQAKNALTISHELSLLLFKRDIKNILIIHINAISTDMLDDLLTLYEKNNVSFISLKDALNDDVYRINPNVVRDRAYTFLNQIRISKKLENPEIVQKLYSTLPEDELEKLCR